MKNELQNRLVFLKKYLADEKDQNSLYAQDLKESIKSCEKRIAFESKTDVKYEIIK